MNLTFLLDGLIIGKFHSTGLSTASGYQPKTPVFETTGLSNSAHVLLVDVGPNSVFFFDFLMYTQGVDDASGSAEGPTDTQLPPPVPSASPITIDEYVLIPWQYRGSSDLSADSLLRHAPLLIFLLDRATKKHNTATFGGAVGGSVGVLAIVSAGLALSIIRRRRLADRRDRLAQEQDSLHHNGSEDTPPMLGPAPFVPRFFPGTVLPADPPPYVYSSASSTSHDDSLGGSYTERVTHPRDMSYADIPPSSPPPLDDGTLPPPPFGVAIASTNPIDPQSGLLALVVDTGSASHTTASVGSIGSDTPLAPSQQTGIPRSVSSRASSIISRPGRLHENDSPHP